MARRISKGERHLAPVKVTIPEGFNVSDIAKAFASKLPILMLINFIKSNRKRRLSFSGYLFFLTTDNEQDVLLLMSDNFEKKILPIRPQIISSGKSEKIL